MVWHFFSFFVAEPNIPLHFLFTCINLELSRISPKKQTPIQKNKGSHEISFYSAQTSVIPNKNIIIQIKTVLLSCPLKPILLKILQSRNIELVQF